MPRSKSHEPNSGFTTTSMRLRREIRDVLLSQITHIDAFKGNAESLATSTNFSLSTSRIEPTIFKVDVKYRKPHIGSTVAQIYLNQSATDLEEAVDAILASLGDGWVWKVT